MFSDLLDLLHSTEASPYRVGTFLNTVPPCLLCRNAQLLHQGAQVNAVYVPHVLSTETDPEGTMKGEGVQGERDVGADDKYGGAIFN